MKTKLFILFILISLANVYGQAVIENNSKIYYSKSDTISYQYSNYSKTLSIVLGRNDTISPGTDGSKNILMTAFIGNDTLKIPYENYPYAKKTFVTVETSKGKFVIAFRYNSVTSNFPQTYMDNNEGKVNFEIPEIYELANIIWILSPSGERGTDLYKNSSYYSEVKKYFKPFLDHQIFKELDFSEEFYYEKYYDFRENSFAYKFDKDKIINNKMYNYVIGNDFNGFNSLFKESIPLIESFAQKSNFKKFYSQHKKYYTNRIERLNKLLPIKNMWTWLEKEFPNKKYNSYKIVFSSLIGGSHSTQYYSTKNKKTNKRFGETVMFICSSDKYDNNKELSENQKTGLMSGVVFTEIDHNYVNPETFKYKKEITSIFSKENYWASAKEKWYKNPILIFNEYMTHSVFCLWVVENFDEKTADFIIKYREDLNVTKRNFIKFKEFNSKLMSIKKQNPNTTIAELYPKIIEWCANQN